MLKEDKLDQEKREWSKQPDFASNQLLYQRRRVFYKEKILQKHTCLEETTSK